MARIDTRNYYTVDDIAGILNRTDSTIRNWIKYGYFSKDDVLVYKGDTYVLKSAVDFFKNRLTN